jgi:hypothetical protein
MNRREAWLTLGLVGVGLLILVASIWSTPSGLFGSRNRGTRLNGKRIAPVRAATENTAHPQ